MKTNMNSYAHYLFIFQIIIMLSSKVLKLFFLGSKVLFFKIHSSIFASPYKGGLVVQLVRIPACHAGGSRVRVPSRPQKKASSYLEAFLLLQFFYRHSQINTTFFLVL